MKNITAQVRSRLLDFLLQLRAKVDRSIPDEELKKRATGFDIANAFKQTVFQGPTNIHIGSHGTQTISQHFAVGDRAELKKVLAEFGLPASELEMLDEAIDTDIEKRGKASMKGATGHWYLDLLGKAAKGTVKIGVDVATAVVGAAITHYVGIS